MTSTNTQPPVAQAVTIQMMDALREAENLAYRHRDKSAAIYSTPRPVTPAVASGLSSPVSLNVLLDDQPAPEGATLVTSVARRACAQPGRLPSMAAVVEQVLANLPAGVELLDRVVVEYYPKRPYYQNDKPSVFAYEFMSTEYRNVATWIPDTSVDGAIMQPGFDGRGRIWKNGTIDGEPTVRISEFIARARQTTFVREVLGWWSDNQNLWRDASGDGVRLFERPPEFVMAAESGESNSAVAALVVAWWAANKELPCGDRKFFDGEPSFVEMAVALQAPAVSGPDSEPARRRMRP